MSRLSKSDVAAIKSELGRPWGEVALRCDQHDVRVLIRPIKPLTYRPIVMVDGRFDYDWTKAESDVGAKFYQRKRGQLFKRAALAEHQKSFGKRARKAMAERGTYSYHTPNWSSVGGLLRHLTKTCQDIELVSVGYPLSTAGEEAAP